MRSAAEIIAEAKAKRAAKVTAAMPSLDMLDSIALDQSPANLTKPIMADTDNSATLDTQLEPIHIVNLPEGEIDPRLKLLSHSSRTMLHTCPRKYQLYRLASDTVSMADDKEARQATTFAYGSAVGVGVQSVLEGKSENQIYLDTFLEWDTDLDYSNKDQKKSFWLALFAVQRFIALRADGFLDEYELVYYTPEGSDIAIPAVELAFIINLPDGYKYRGFLDAVLRHKTTGEILVLECKTSSGTANSAMYKNSGQALGYSVVLDIMFPEMSSYHVLYLVYETREMSYKELPYTKSLLQRALWLQELLIDCQVISLYQSYETYPMCGHSCFNFYRDCEYLGLCTLTTKNLTKPLTQQILDKIEKDEEKYHFSVDFYDLVEAQISKGDL